jgi:microcystin-dependent protein
MIRASGTGQTDQVGSHAHSGGTGGINANHTHAFGTGGRSAYHGHAITVNNSSAANASQAHTNLQPYIVLNYIIKH